MKEMLEDRPNRVKRDEQTCLSYWFPKLQATGVRVPKTTIVHTDGVDLIHLCDGVKPEGYSTFIDKMCAACEDIGYPIFLRTGFTSGKHSWDKTCFLVSPDNIKRHIRELVEFSFTADFFGLPVDVWAVREYIPMVTAFKAFWGNMPINKERRYFIRHGLIECFHPYWPTEAFEHYTDNLPLDWEKQLEELNHQDADEVKLLTATTMKVAVVFSEYWSLDWSLAQDGGWVAIDMARGEDSYHWPDCSALKEVEK